MAGYWIDRFNFAAAALGCSRIQDPKGGIACRILNLLGVDQRVSDLLNCNEGSEWHRPMIPKNVMKKV